MNDVEFFGHRAHPSLSRVKSTLVKPPSQLLIIGILKKWESGPIASRKPHDDKRTGKYPLKTSTDLGALSTECPSVFGLSTADDCFEYLIDQKTIQDQFAHEVDVV
jgi:hypothetical protein